LRKRLGLLIGTPHAGVSGAITRAPRTEDAQDGWFRKKSIIFWFNEVESPMPPRSFYFLTLFPEVIKAYAQSSMMKKAVDKGILHIEAINIRDFTTDKHNKVDAPPYGGGAGMVLACQPVVDAYRSLLPRLSQHRRVILTSPAGKPFQHAQAKAWSETAQDVVFFCGHYEGFDERIFTLIPEIEDVSIGDFVLTGGELPALSMMDAMARFIPDVVKEADSVMNDSFYYGLLDHPHYTRPAEFEGHKVPDVLLNGDHAKIASWRCEQALIKTRRTRPDMLDE